MRNVVVVLGWLALAGWAAPLQAAEFGTAAEANAMLQRAVVALKANKAAALAKFNKGEDGFRDRYLYVFCSTPATPRPWRTPTPASSARTCDRLRT